MGSPLRGPHPPPILPCETPAFADYILRLSDKSITGLTSLGVLCSNRHIRFLYELCKRGVRSCRSDYRVLVSAHIFRAAREYVTIKVQ